jgi:hypothetical protein
MGQRNFSGQPSEAGAFVSAEAGQPEILIDDDHLRFGPTQLTGFVSQGVLARRRLAVMLDLGWR